MRRHVHPRGFTVAELVVSLGVTAFALAATAGIFITQQRMTAQQEGVRVAQDTARRALMVLDRAVRRAGFGIDPPLAFDMNQYPAYDTAAGSVPGCQSGTAAPCPRDAVNATDQLVFMARDQLYQLGGAGGPIGHAWIYQSSTASAVRLSLRAGDGFRTGQVLQIVCASGTDATYVTVASPGLAAVTNAGAVDVPLEAAGTDPWHGQARLGSQLCYANGGGTTTMAFVVNRYHFFVRSYPDGSGGTVPWLMLDQGIDQNDDKKADASDWLPVAENVEDLQVAYLMNSGGAATAPDSNQDWVYGNAPGTVEAPDPAAAAPSYLDNTLETKRFNANPANVRGVRYDLVMRASARDTKTPGDTPPALENRNASFPATGTFRRLPFTGITSTPNLESRRRFLF